MDTSPTDLKADAQDLPVKVKQEPKDDIKDYAETTMNELLGWYGYDKVSSSETEQLNLGRYRRDESGNEGDSMDGDGDNSLDGSGSVEDGESGRLSAANSESSLAAQHRNLVSALTRRHDTSTPGLSDSSSPTSYVVCAWCQKTGMKLFTLKSPTGLKAFCSEVCFTQCRRASFKKNKICDWCKHVRHTVNYVDFQDGDQQLQFCSSKCLNQYKMNIFCRETQEHLKMVQQMGEESDDSSSPSGNDKHILITPDLWLSKRQGAKVKSESKCEEETAEEKESNEKNNILHRSSETPKRFETASGADRFAKDRERLRRAIRESRDSARSSSPPRSSRHSPQKLPVPDFPHWVPPPHLLSPGMPPLGMFNQMMMGGLFGNPSSERPLGSPNRHREKMSSSTTVHPVSSPDTSPSSTSTTPNLQRTPSSATEPNLRSVSTHNSAPPISQGLPRGGLGAGLFPFGGLPGGFPPLLPGDPALGGMFPPLMAPFLPGQCPPPGIPPPPAGNGVPPVTVMVPFPVVLPLPVPIPIPLPITPERLAEFFAKKKTESNAQSEEKVSPSTSEVYQTSTPARSSTTPLSPKVHFKREHPSRENMSRESRESISSGYLESVLCKPHHPQRSESAEPAITLKKGDTKPPYLIDSQALKRSLTPTSAKSLDLTKRPRLESRSNDTGAIDLSKDSCVSDSELMGKENHRVYSIKERPSSVSKTDTEEQDVEPGTLKVPRIHIVSTAGDPPLASQQMPLPPTDHAYSLRRSLILDAPAVPKPQKNTYNERPYVRSVPRDMIEAARRRCLRARVRTK